MSSDLLRLVVVGGVVLVAVAVGLWTRRRPAIGAGPPSAPDRVDRGDFPRRDAPWLVVLFSSDTCESCAAMVGRVEPLESPEVAVAEVSAERDRLLHRTYGIESVPTTLIVAQDGEVVGSFVGPVSATHLWAAVAEAREPGSVPGGCGADPPDLS